MMPVSRLRSRLGLNPYNKSAPVTYEEIKPKKVKISLLQHIGAQAVPVVKKGDDVTVGQMIASAAEDALSVSIHSSVNGKVTEITDRSITITL